MSEYLRSSNTFEILLTGVVPESKMILVFCDRERVDMQKKLQTDES